MGGPQVWESYSATSMGWKNRIMPCQRLIHCWSLLVRMLQAEFEANVTI
jgi:hypothetical protein